MNSSPLIPMYIFSLLCRALHVDTYMNFRRLSQDHIGAAKSIPEQFSSRNRHELIDKCKHKVRQQSELVSNVISKIILHILIELISVMELRLVSDPLLRSRMLPLLPFLAPSIPLLWRATALSPQVQWPMPKSPRYGSSSIHTTARRRAGSSTNTADLDFLEDKPSQKPPQSSVPQRGRPDDVLRNQVDKLLDATFQAPSPAKRNPIQSARDASADESSAEMMETAFRNSVRNPRAPIKSYQEIARKMQFPPQHTDSERTPSSFTNDMYQALQQNTTPRPAKRAKRTVRSRPAVGRTIEVMPERGVDVGRAFKNLDITCALNRVRLDQSRQRFHERAGMKRKRLKSERWRKMFKESFRATVMRVKEMRRKGW